MNEGCECNGHAVPRLLALQPVHVQLAEWHWLAQLSGASSPMLPMQ